MTKYSFPEGAAVVFGGSGGLGSGVVNLLADSGVNVAFTYLTNEKAAKENLKSIENSTMDISDNKITDENIPEVKVHKKRGRKPKGGKIVEFKNILVLTNPFKTK